MELEKENISENKKIVIKKGIKGNKPKNEILFGMEDKENRPNLPPPLPQILKKLSVFS